MIDILSRWWETHSVKASPSPDWEYKTYPPSILIVGENSSSTLRLRQRLENKGCWVCRTDIDSNSLLIARREYFDIVVLKLERLDESSLEICNLLEADPQLAHIPLIVLASFSCAEVTSRSKMDKVYCLPAADRDVRVGTRLLQIIEYVHYMTYRYG